MTPLEIILSLLSAVGVFLGTVATYRSSRTQQKKNDDDRYENYTNRIEARLKDVENKLESAEREIDELKSQRSKDTRWKRVATRHIEELHHYIQIHLGADRNDLPVMPEELKTE